MDWHTNVTNIMPVTGNASSTSWSEGPLVVRANCGTDDYWAKWDVQPGWSMPFPGIFCYYPDAPPWGGLWCPGDDGKKPVSFFFSGHGFYAPGQGSFGYNTLPPDQFCGDLQSSDCLFVLQVTTGMRSDTLPGLCPGNAACQQFTGNTSKTPLMPPDNCALNDLNWQEVAEDYGRTCDAAATLFGDPAYMQCFNCYRDAKVRNASWKTWIYSISFQNRSPPLFVRTRWSLPRTMGITSQFLLHLLLASYLIQATR